MLSLIHIYPPEISTTPLRIEKGLTPQTLYNTLVGRLGLVGSVLESQGTGPIFQEAEMYTVCSKGNPQPMLMIFRFTDGSQAQKSLEDVYKRQVHLPACQRTPHGTSHHDRRL